ncbi:MAG: FkbM family methyltransferase [Bacteroidota bacterium]
MLQQFKSWYRKSYKRLRFRLSASNNVFFLGFYRYFYQAKAGSLSDFLDTYSKDKQHNFTVVQVGANDGMTNDPIHKFIKRDRWKGVLLEPQTEVYREYLEPLHRRSKGLHTLCAAVGASDGQRNLYKIGFTDMRWATGMASFDRTVLEKAFDNGLIAKRCEHYSVELPNEPEKHIVAEPTLVISPPTLLEKYKIQQIDLLQIDTEGYDYQVIRLFDIATTKPKAIIFEHKHLSPADKQACYDLLDQNAYAHKEFGSNTLAISKEMKDYLDFVGK